MKSFFFYKVLGFRVALQSVGGDRFWLCFVPFSVLPSPGPPLHLCVGVLPPLSSSHPPLVLSLSSKQHEGGCNWEIQSPPRWNHLYLNTASWLSLSRSHACWISLTLFFIEVLFSDSAVFSHSYVSAGSIFLPNVTEFFSVSLLLSVQLSTVCCNSTTPPPPGGPPQPCCLLFQFALLVAV